MRLGVALLGCGLLFVLLAGYLKVPSDRMSMLDRPEAPDSFVRGYVVGMMNSRPFLLVAGYVLAVAGAILSLFSLV